MSHDHEQDRQTDSNQHKDLFPPDFVREQLQLTERDRYVVASLTEWEQSSLKSKIVLGQPITYGT